MHPCARQDNLLVTEMNDEVVIHDLERHVKHRLGRPAVVVWRHCNGERTITDLTRIVKAELHIQADEEVVWLLLAELERAHLLRDLLLRPKGVTGMSRRQALALGLAGATSLLVQGCGVDSTTVPTSTPVAPSSNATANKKTAEPLVEPSPGPSVAPSPEPSPSPSPPPQDCKCRVSLDRVVIGISATRDAKDTLTAFKIIMNPTGTVETPQGVVAILSVTPTIKLKAEYDITCDNGKTKGKTAGNISIVVQGTHTERLTRCPAGDLAFLAEADLDGLKMAAMQAIVKGSPECTVSNLILVIKDLNIEFEITATLICGTAKSEAKPLKGKIELIPPKGTELTGFVDKRAE